MAFLYTIDPSADEPIMLINKHIGTNEEDGAGIIGDLFQQELLTLDGMDKKRIQVWINSPGGSVFDAFNIVNAILKSKTKVDTYNVGIAASSAGWVFAAGRTRHMADYSSLMCHNPYVPDSESEPDAGLLAMRDSIAKILSERSNTPVEKIMEMMDKTTWLNAADALSAGFCDVIEVTSQHNKKRVSGITNTTEKWRMVNNILNKQFNTTTMTKVANKLNLVDDAKEDSIIKAIEAIENRATAAEALNKTNAEDLAKMKNDLDEMQNKVNDFKKKYEDAAAELGTANAAKKVAEDAALHTKCENMVKGFAAVGKIKAEAVNKWVEKAKVDFPGTEDLLKDLPINKAAVKLTEVTDPSVTTGYNAASVMAGIQAKTKKQ